MDFNLWMHGVESKEIPVPHKNSAGKTGFEKGVLRVLSPMDEIGAGGHVRRPVGPRLRAAGVVEHVIAPAEFDNLIASDRLTVIRTRRSQRQDRLVLDVAPLSQITRG